MEARLGHVRKSSPVPPKNFPPPLPLPPTPNKTTSETSIIPLTWHMDPLIEFYHNDDNAVTAPGQSCWEIWINLFDDI